MRAPAPLPGSGGGPAGAVPGGAAPGRGAGRGDAELGVRVVQVVAHRAGAEEELRRDLLVGAARGGEPHHLQLLRREPVEGAGAAPPRPGVAQGRQLGAGTFRPEHGTDVLEPGERGAELRPRLGPAPPAAQPLPVGQPGAGHVVSAGRVLVQPQRAEVEVLGLVVGGEQGAAAEREAVRHGPADGPGWHPSW